MHLGIEGVIQKDVVGASTMEPRSLGGDGRAVALAAVAGARAPFRVALRPPGDGRYWMTEGEIVTCCRTAQPYKARGGRLGIVDHEAMTWYW